MNGKDIFLGLGCVHSKFIEEAESGTLDTARGSGIKRPLLIAAVIALSALLVGCGIVYARGWFQNFFADKGGTPLNEGQVSYISENEQILSGSNTQNGWTVELRSAIQDGTTGYIILGVTAPEGVSLEPKEVDGRESARISAGNDSMFGHDRGVPSVLSFPKGVLPDQWSYRWEEDGDGLPNTKNYVLQFYPNFEESTIDPFGPDAVYPIQILNFVRESHDDAYENSLLDGKYAGQDGVMFTQEEIARMHKTDILAEGTWDFTVTFAQSKTGVELLSQPITVMGHAYREGPPLNEYINDVVESYEPVKVTSFVLSPLSATISYECDASCNFAFKDDEHIYAVMKDGSRTELRDSGIGGLTYTVLDPPSPIVVEQVDHILMADGTEIPVP